MKYSIACVFVLVAPLCAENLFSNGAMDTAGGWKGDGKIVKEEAPKGEALAGKEKTLPNRYLQVSPKKNGPVSFSQEVDTKGLVSVTVTFSYQTKNYQGPGMELRGIRMDRGFTFMNRKLEADGEWHEMTWEFMQVAGSKKIDFSFILLQGEGEVLFDNFSAEAGK